MVKISEILSKNIAILHTDGLKIYNAIMEEIAADNHCVLNFEDVIVCTTAFLNASLGKAYLNSPDIDKKIEVIRASSEISNKIEWVRDNALNQAKREARESALSDYFENA